MKPIEIKMPCAICKLLSMNSKEINISIIAAARDQCSFKIVCELNINYHRHILKVIEFNECKKIERSTCC